MLTYDDCVGLCGLTAEEIDTIARYEFRTRCADPQGMKPVAT
jgi:hypothetical protein